MRGWIPARISGHQPSTCYDLMWSWCNKRHAPSPFSHEPLSSSHASTAVLPLPIYVRIHGTRIKNEKRGKRSGQTSQNADRRKRNGTTRRTPSIVIALRDDLLKSHEILAGSMLRFSRSWTDSPTVRSRGNDLIGRRSDLIPGEDTFLSSSPPLLFLLSFFVHLLCPFETSHVNYYSRL